MEGYGQFCPVAKAMELLDERWTLLVVRELLCGSRRFGDLRRGLPRISPALLSKRLRMLERAGVVDRVLDDGRPSYTLTAAGRELQPVVEALGRWGVRWIGELGDADLDPRLLMWDLHRNVDLAAVPPGRVVVHFHFRGLRDDADWWLVIDGDRVDVCDFNPGHPVTVTADADLRALTRVWRGDIGWREALLSGGVTLHGAPRHRRALPTWFPANGLALVPRPA